MSMPFEWPAGYAPAIQAPAEPPERSLWFAFRGAEMLVTAPPEVALPHCNHPKTLGMMPQRIQYLGVLGVQHFFAAELAAGGEGPHGGVRQGVRPLLVALDEPQLGPAGPAP